MRRSSNPNRGIHPIKIGPCTCYLIRGRETILIDAGIPGKAKTFSRSLSAAGIAPEEIKAIVITHCHFDHIGCAQGLKEMTGAKIVVHKNEREFFENGKIILPKGVTPWGRLLAALLVGLSGKKPPVPCSADIVIEGDETSLEAYGIKGKIVFTPGHSSGSMSVLLASGDAFVGDMAMNGLPMTMGPDLPIFAEDLPGLKKSWERLIAMGARRIYPAHGTPFPVEKIAPRIVS